MSHPFSAPRFLVLAGILGFGAPGLHFALDDGDQAGPPMVRYEVSITNLTRGQVLSPPIVAVHDERMSLFTLGEPASSELAMVAEDAMGMPLIQNLTSSPHVADVQVAMAAGGGPLPPGQTATVTLNGTPASFDRISLVSMLVTTNDAFCALNGSSLPRRGAAEFTAIAYDAGSEENNEQCAFIPGPPCMNAGVRATANAEGFVHVHAGIHGVGDLDAARFDWRNPVARVVVRRVR